VPEIVWRAGKRVILSRSKVAKACLLETGTIGWDDPGPMEEAMAHREQHGNREAKKPKKEKSKGPVTAQSTKWSVSELVEDRPEAKH
jgi:hypothetical protein